MKILVVYDNTVSKSEGITDVIGSHGFADVVVKKKSVETHYREQIETCLGAVSWVRVDVAWDFSTLLSEKLTMQDARVVHCFSNFVFRDAKAAGLSLQKLAYVDVPYRLMAGDAVVAVLFPGVAAYTQFCRAVTGDTPSLEVAAGIADATQIAGMENIGNMDTFVRFMTGGFEARYFNVLTSHDYTLTKSSADRRKIRAEYTYYHLLPDDMKMWFVMPFAYEEDASRASYTMERLHMTDLAIKWVHGSIDEREFAKILDRFFFFFAHRHEKPCTEAAYRESADALYVQKVQTRIEKLKAAEGYAHIARLLSEPGVYDVHSVDALAEKYFRLKEKTEQAAPRRYTTVIGHGDPCFSNTLYNKSTRMLKFIDPKGALTEAELRTNPYYDVAKLSHSVCGQYDFFNSGRFEIKVGEDLRLQLELPPQNPAYMRIFREKVEAAGFDFRLVRLYEASLFLSMLPLHMDYPQKVLGFILNAERILKEVEGLA